MITVASPAPIRDRAVPQRQVDARSTPLAAASTRAEERPSVRGSPTQDEQQRIA
jgi:hypothetical protein